MCVTNRHDMTLALKVALNPNTINQSVLDIDVLAILSLHILTSLYKVDSQ